MRCRFRSPPATTHPISLPIWECRRYWGASSLPADAPGGNASPVAVLSYLFWKKQYGGRLDIIGKTIELDHMPYTVIGVASPRFTWGDSDVYMPGNFKADPHYYMTPSSS